MIAGLRDPEGALYVTTAAPVATDPRVGGVTLTPDGVVKVNANTPQVFDQGKGFMINGALCIDVAGSAIVGYVGGLPVTATGALKCQLDQPVSPGDAFVGGIRVGPLGGVCIIDADPSTVPVNTGPPVLSGTFASGQTVASTSGAWTGTPAPTYAYQWYAEGAPVSGATNANFTITDSLKGADLYCRVTATNVAGSASANSNTKTVAHPYAQAVLALTPLVYYRLADSAAPFDDESASNSNATLVGTGIAYQQPGLLSNDSNTAVALSGTTTAIVSAHLSAMGNNNPFTIVVPFKVSNLSANRTLWQKGNNNGANLQGHILMVNANGSLEFVWNRSATWRSVLSATGLVVANVKALWAFAYDGSLNFKIYKNGVLVENLTMINQPMANTLPLYIGATRLNAGPTQTFNGTLDEFAYFSRVLTAEEVAGLFQAYLTGTPA